MSYYVPQRHYYILHYSYNVDDKIKTEKTEVPKLDIKYDKFVVIQNQHNHTVLLNLDNVTVIEEVTEDL